MSIALPAGFSRVRLVVGAVTLAASSISEPLTADDTYVINFELIVPDANAADVTWGDENSQPLPTPYAPRPAPAGCAINLNDVYVFGAAGDVVYYVAHYFS